MVRVRVGDFEVVPILQHHYQLDPDRLFSTFPPEDRQGWYWQPPFVKPDGQLTIDMGGFLIRSPAGSVLVDIGVGNHKTRPNPLFHMRDDHWVDDLAAEGLPADEVRTIAFTHLHHDHVGNATRWQDGKWVPTFPNAEHLTTAPEIDFWRSADAEWQYRRMGRFFDDSIAPLIDAELLRAVEPDHEVVPGLTMRFAPGHTPGNCYLEIESRGRRAVLCGDMVHHALQFAHPAQSTDMCVDPERSGVARTALLESLADTDDLLFPAHAPDQVPGRIRRQDKGFRWVPLGVDEMDQPAGLG